MKYFQINLAQYVQDLHTEKYKILLKEMKKALNKWKDILCSWVGRLNIGNMSILLTLTYGLDDIPIKIPEGVFLLFLVESDKLIPKSV